MTILFIILTIIFASSTSFLFMDWIKNRDERSNFKKYYDPTEYIPETVLVYTSKDGTKWYGFKKVLDMPATRALQAEAAARFSEICMTPDYFARKMLEIQGFASKQNFAKVSAIAQDLIQKSTAVAEEASLCALANELFFIEGENPRYSSEKHFDKKMEIWKSDMECAAFFLSAALKHTRLMDGLSGADLLTYLKNKESEKRLTQISQSQASFMESFKNKKQQTSS